MNKENYNLNDDEINSQNDDDILELVYQIDEYGMVVNLKEKREKEALLAKRILENEKSDKKSADIENDDVENTDNDDGSNESDEEYQAYLSFKKKINDIGLKTLLKKVNAPDINHQISVYTHENDLLSQSILLTVVACIKPLYTMGVNISKDDVNMESDKLQLLKNYIKDNFEKIKLEIISRYNDNRTHKISIDKGIDEELKKNLHAFNEILINNFLIWINLGFESSAFYAEEYKQIDERLSNHIDAFMNKYLDEIFLKISF